MIAIDSECTGLFIHKGCRAFTISAACDENKSYLWNFPVNPKTREVFYTPKVLQNFKDTIAKHDDLIFHNANFDIQALVATGIPLEYFFDNHNIHDTMVMSHAYYSPGPHGLKQLGVTLLQFPEDDEKRLGDISKLAAREAKKIGWTIAEKANPHPSLKGNQDSWHKADYWIPAQLAKYLKYPSDHPWRTICNEYAEKDAIRTLGIYYIFQELMTARQKVAYHKARKLIEPILRMQYEKVTLIPEELKKAKVHFSSRFHSQLTTVKKIVGNKDFNPNSPLQLRKVLFDKYKFKSTKVGKTGDLSTDKNVITALLRDCPTSGPIPDKFKFLIDLKKLRKIKTTRQYLDNYDTHRDSENRLQPFFKQTATGTNRLACENPNTTNVGKADMNNPFTAQDIHLDLDEEEVAFKLRNVFGPNKGEIWTCIDYTQFQLLIFAVVSGSQQLVDSYLKGIDLHHAVAVEIFGTDDISSVQRTAAKAINFGLLFGAGPAKIEQTAGMPGLYNKFLSQLPGAKKYLEAQASLVRSKGYVHTVGGYRLYVPKDRAYAASCYVIQGTEAEIVRDAMVDVSNYTYSTPSCPYRMIMMVHDELVLRSPSTNSTHLSKIMRLMERAGEKIGIPCKVDAELVTSNWSEKTPLSLSI